jgi:hypothetical protein
VTFLLDLSGCSSSDDSSSDDSAGSNDVPIVVGIALALVLFDSERTRVTLFPMRTALVPRYLQIKLRLGLRSAM